MPLKLSNKEINSKRSPRGGWSRKTLAEWGVPWPPPHGWRQALLNGLPIPDHGEKLPFGEQIENLQRRIERLEDIISRINDLSGELWDD